jgi:predicted amidohydrolase YtcJ
MILRICLVMLVLIASACAREPAVEVADLVITGANIVTMNPAQPEASALAARAGKIAYVGDHAGAEKWIGKSTRVLKLAGVTVLPGLIDTHIHLMDGALALEYCMLSDQKLTYAQMAPFVRECIGRTPGDGWVVMYGVNTPALSANLKAVDALLPDRPLLLWGTDGHTGFTNSAGLKRVGIRRDTPDPAGGNFGRDRSGALTGLLADTALDVVSNQLDKPTPEKRERVLLKLLHDLAGAGITTFMEAHADAETVATYVSLARKNQLPARVSFALHTTGEATDEEFSRLKALRQLAESQPQLRVNLIKLFEDGGLEYPLQTAALLEPYAAPNGKPGKNRGELRYEIGPLTEFVQRADKEGFGIHMHAIGDRAARVGLDAFAAARAAGSKRPYSFAHLLMVDPADLPRFRELDVTASLQLQWARPDNYTVESVLPYIGPQRQARLYPERSLWAAGARVAGGSDWDVSTYNPFEAIAIAMSRTNPDEPERGVLGHGEELTLREMYAAYTVNAAQMLEREGEVGSLEPGKAANIVVLNRRLGDASSSADVLATKVVYTFNDGTQLVGPAGN